MRAFAPTPIHVNYAIELSERLDSITTLGKFQLFMGVLLSHVHDEAKIIVAPDYDVSTLPSINRSNVLIFGEEDEGLTVYFWH